MRKASEMKNKIFPIFLTLTGLLFVLQGFSGCAHPHSSFSSSDSSNKKTVLITAKIQNLPSVNTSESERLAKSAFPVLSDTLTYSLSYKPQGSSTTWQAMTGSYPDFQLISPSGTYILKLEGFSDADKTNPILTGQASVTIDEDSVVKTVSFIMQPPETATGNGSVNLKLSAASDTNISAFTLTATKTGSTEEISLSWECFAPGSSSSGTVKANIPAGSYTVTITGIANNKPVYSRTEKFTVWEGLTTSSWIMADGTVTDELMIKAENLYSTFYVKGSSGPYNFYTDGVFGNVPASDTNSGSMGSPLLTVSAAVNKCVFSNKPYTIYVDGTVKETKYTDYDPTAISISNGKKITIKSLPIGETKTKAVIQANGNGRIIFAGGTVVLEDLKLTGGGNTNRGGGIYLDGGSLTMKNCTITDCDAENYGGGLYLSRSSTANLSGCTISSNTAQNGAGIYLRIGTATLTDCIITGNSAINNDKSGKGGGICLESVGRLTTTNCTISGNSTKLSSTVTTGNGSQIYAVIGSMYNGETLAANKVID